MLDKLHKLLFTALLLVFVSVVLWWTLFLRERFSGSELALQAKEERIEELARSLEDAEAERGALTGELEAARTQLVVRDRTIAEQAGTIDEQGRAIDTLETDLEATREELAASEAEVRSLEAALRLLKVDRRLARVEVIRREDTPEGPRTHLRFVEIGPDGLPAGEPRQFSVAGTRVYFEALVIKFDDQYVEAGDFLRGTSVCLFGRAFGDRQSPEEGVRLETRGQRPAAYGLEGQTDPFYDDLWEHFWAYAEDPEAAREKGVRALHGEAPFIEARPGRRYRIVLRASGGLTITPE